MRRLLLRVAGAVLLGCATMPPPAGGGLPGSLSGARAGGRQMSRSTRVLVAAATCLGLALLAGCKHVPADASVKDFCSKGEKFSASTTFEQGVRAAEGLRRTGTP